MLRSFRVALIITVVAAAILPVLAVSIPFIYKIYTINRESAVKELALTAERVVNDAEHELTFVSARFVDIGLNKDMVLAATSPFFGYRAVELSDEFVKQSPLVESVYLLDNKMEVLESIPEISAIADISRVKMAVQKAMPNPSLFRGKSFWLMVEDAQLIAELEKNHNSQFVSKDKRILVLAMPLFFQNYVQDQMSAKQGVLIAIVPLDRLRKFSQRHLETYQSLALLSNDHPAPNLPENEDKQIAYSSFKIGTPTSTALNLTVQLAEPNSVRFQSVRKTLVMLPLFVVGVSLVFSIFAFFLARRLGGGLQQLLGIAKEYAGGNYRVVATKAGFDEFKQIGRTLEDMGHRIDDQLEELRSANQQLKQADKLKDDFLANTSHELRTPLHGIIGIASSLIEGVAGELTPKVHRNLRLIEQSGRRLENLVNDILDFSKIRNQALQLSIKPVEIFSLVDIVLSLHAAQAERAGLKLVNAVPRSLPLADADEFRLQQILHNLVGNALKFTPEGEIRVAAKVIDRFLFISVTDTGIGMQKETLDTIFQPFVQLEGALTRSHAGSGLGLSISRNLVELHGGHLSVESDPLKGSTFTFTLPISEEQDADTFVEIGSFQGAEDEPESLAQVERPLSDIEVSIESDEVATSVASAPAFMDRVNPHQAQVVLVDDEPINLEILSNYFFNEPYTLHKATSGPEALELIDSLPSIDLVLLDVMMPKMSGFEVCRRIRANPKYEHVPILFLTARNQAKDIHQGFALGANDYLVKPITRVELITRCQYHLHYARIKSELEFLNSSLELKVEARTQELQQMLEVIQRNSNIFRALLEVSIELQKQTELSESLAVTFEKLGFIFPNRGFAVCLGYGQQTNGLKLYSRMPAEVERDLDAALASGRGWYQEKSLALHNLLVLPLFAAGQIRLGDLVIWPAQLDINEREVVELYSRQLSAVVENRRLTDELERISIVDPLTGAFNRRYFEQAFSNLCYTFARHPDRHFCVMSIDIDGLKAVNDTYGHQAGDVLIRHVVNILLDCLRQTDVICRIGGDEFVVIAESTGFLSAATLKNRLVAAQTDSVYEVEGREGEAVKLSARFSVGLASTEDTLPDDLLRVADQQMYAAKQESAVKDTVQKLPPAL